MDLDSPQPRLWTAGDPRGDMGIAREDNRIINGLWIGSQLSPMELLTMKSFVAHGHSFVLWAYDDGLAEQLPPGVRMRDANEIIPQSQVFCYSGGLNAGSYGGFSDIFRYKLLYELGGWWVDMDVTCLKPFDFPAPYVFRPNLGRGPRVIGNILKAPAGSELMRRCYELTRAAVDAQNTNWGKPLVILSREIENAGLSDYILPRSCVTRDCEDPFRLAFSRVPPRPTWYAIHWCNELWRVGGRTKSVSRPGTTYCALLQQYGLAPVK